MHDDDGPGRMVLPGLRAMRVVLRRVRRPVSDGWRRQHAQRLCEYVHTRGYCPGLVAREIESMFYPRAAITPEMKSLIQMMLELREARES